MTTIVKLLDKWEETLERYNKYSQAPTDEVVEFIQDLKSLQIAECDKRDLSLQSSEVDVEKIMEAIECTIDGYSDHGCPEMKDIRKVLRKYLSTSKVKEETDEEKIYTAVDDGPDGKCTIYYRKDTDGIFIVDWQYESKQEDGEYKV